MVHSVIYRMIMTPGPKSRAGCIVSSGTLNKNSYCLVSRNDRPFKKKKKKKILPLLTILAHYPNGVCGIRCYAVEATSIELKERDK